MSQVWRVSVRARCSCNRYGVDRRNQVLVSQVRCESMVPGACVTGAVCIDGARCLYDRYGVYQRRQVLM